MFAALQSVYFYYFLIFAAEKYIYNNFLIISKNISGDVPFTN